MRGGTYNLSQTVTIAPGNNGTSSARKKLSAYPGETPVLNFSAQSEDPANRGLAVNGNYWHVNGLIVERAGDNGIFVGGSNNIIERTMTRFNRDTGLQLSRIAAEHPAEPVAGQQPRPERGVARQRRLRRRGRRRLRRQAHRRVRQRLPLRGVAQQHRRRLGPVHQDRHRRRSAR